MAKPADLCHRVCVARSLLVLEFWKLEAGQKPNKGKKALFFFFFPASFANKTEEQRQRFIAVARLSDFQTSMDDLVSSYNGTVSKWNRTPEKSNNSVRIGDKLVSAP